MNRILSILAVVIFQVPAFGAVAGTPRISVLSVPGNTPGASDIASVLERHLKNIPVKVDVSEAETLPSTFEEWIKASGKAAKESPGTVGLFGYHCNEQVCRLFIVDYRSRAVTQLATDIDKNAPNAASASIVAAIREALLGPLFPELERLRNEAEQPGPPHVSLESSGWWKSPSEDMRRISDAWNVTSRPWIWLEVGYQGDCPYPVSQPQNGFFVGVGLEHRKRIGTALSIGWLGIREGESTVGTVRLHRLTSSFAVRVIFAVGKAHVVIAPSVRLDTVFVERLPISRKSSHSTALEIQVGGLTTWHLPIMRRLEVVVGAGVLGTVLARDHGLDNAGIAYGDIIPASKIRLIWIAGIAWSPSGH
jgi:hypothetical protein